MIDEIKYKGFFCIKCNNIPLIQIIPKKENIYLLFLCKCCKKYENIDIFMKNYFKDDIPINQINKDPIIIPSQEIKKESIFSIIKNFNKIKEQMEKHSKEIKEKLNDYKDIDYLNIQYNNYIFRNNKILGLIESFFSSYNIIEDNPSIQLNIINNSCFNSNYYKTPNSFLLNSSKDIYYQQCIKYYNTEYIISEASIPEQLKEKIYCSHSNTVNCFLKLYNNIYVSNIKKNPNVIIYNLNDLNSKLKISFKAHNEQVSWIIKSSKNNLITCGDEGVVKIWNLIPENLFSIIDKTKTEPKNQYIINYDLNPIYEYKIELNEIKNIKKLLNITDNTFLALTDNCILLFEYSIKDDKEDKSKTDTGITQINLIKKMDIKIIDLILIEINENEKMIGAYSNTKLYILNINNLEIIKEMNINNCPDQNCLIQLNENEIMIAQNEPEPNLIVIDINKWKIKLMYKNNKNTDYLYKLKDGTILQSGPKGKRRFMINNFVELPILYKPFNDTEFDYPYECYEKISCLTEIKDGKLMICVVIGKMSIGKLLFL